MISFAPPELADLQVYSYDVRSFALVSLQMDFFPISDKEEAESVLELLKEILERHYRPETSRAYPDLAELESGFFQCNSRAPERGIGLSAALRRFLEGIYPASVDTWNPYFLNQCFSGVCPSALLGDALASMMNLTLATADMSLLATRMERALSSWMADLLGLPYNRWGIFLPGGALSNLFALRVARWRSLAEFSRGDALFGERGVVLASRASHYSIRTAADFLGLGLEGFLALDTDGRGRMSCSQLRDALRRCRSEGITPVAVVATLGTTVEGAFDPLAEIISICRRYQVHLHVDASFGGIMALTSRRDEFFSGLEAADTLVWDAHKAFPVSLPCSVLFARDPSWLKVVFSSNADYLFHERFADTAGISPYGNSPEDEDLGHYTFLCGKRFHALKLWFFWVTHGTSFLRKMAAERLELMDYVRGLLSADGDFELLSELHAPVVCFRYRFFPVGRGDELHIRVREEAKRRGVAFFNIARLATGECFRVVLVNHLCEKRHFLSLLDFLRDECRRYL